MINGIAVGFIFKFFYTRGFVFDTVLQWCGFQLDNLPYWLKDQRINNISLVATSVWRYFGQNMVLFIGAIMSVDSELYEAAMLDGANKFQQFIYIILPSIKTIITLNVILSITGSLSAFEPPYVITDGANGTGTYFGGYARDRAYPAEGRSGICHGDHPAIDHFRSNDPAEAVL